MLERVFFVVEAVPELNCFVVFAEGHYPHLFGFGLFALRLLLA